jgi:hypothetical protein
VIGPRSLRSLHAAIDLRDRWVVRRDRRRRSGGPIYGPRPLPRPVTVTHAAAAPGPVAWWPPIHADDQRDVQRALVAAKRVGGVHVLVLHRKGSTVAIDISNFGVPFTAVEQRRLAAQFNELKPPKAYGRIRPWLAADGALLTTAAVYDDDRWSWRGNQIDPALERIAEILAGDAERGDAAA